MYGAPRIWAELRLLYGVRCSRKRVARLMRLAGIAGVRRGRVRGTTRRDEGKDPYPYLVRRHYAAEAPNRLWVADLTPHPTDEGWLYLASILDASCRRVVGWAMGERATAELVVDALNNGHLEAQAPGPDHPLLIGMIDIDGEGVAGRP